MRVLTVLAMLAAAALAQDFGKATPFVRAGFSKLQSDPKGALEDFAKAIEAEPKLGIGYYGRGAAYLALEDNKAALEAYAKAIELGFTQAHGARALARQSLHDYDGALEDFTVVLTANPRDGRVLFQRASLNALVGDWKGAVADYTTFIEQVNAEAGTAWTERAIAKMYLDDFKGALEDLEAAIYCNADDSGVYLARGRVLARAGRREEAAADFEKARLIAPKSAHVMFSRARFHHDGGDLDAARASLEKTIALDPKEEYARLYLCLAECRLDNREKGVAKLKAYLDAREKKDDWFAKVAAFLTGSLDEAGFLAAAKVENKWLTREQECEAYWYAGAMRLAAGDAEKAKEYFGKSVATKMARFIEYDSAAAELKRS